MLYDDTWNYWQNKPLGLPPDVCTAFQLNAAQSKGIISNGESGCMSYSSKYMCSKSSTNLNFDLQYVDLSPKGF